MFSKVGVISDTHGLLRPEVLSAFRGCDMIIHAGDIGGQALLDELGKIAPVHAVRGNMDRGSWTNSLPYGDMVQIHDHLIYVLHDLWRMDLDPVSAKFDMIISGHSHKPALFEKKSVFYLNPGSAGPRRFSLPVTVATINATENGLYPEIIQLDV